MTRCRAALVAAALLMPGTALAQPPRQAYDVVDTVVLPKGDPAGGRKAFRELKCHVCHRVSGEDEFSSPAADLKGPDLNATLQLQTSSDIAAAIIAPSHSLSVRTSEAVKARLASQGLSPMGDFSAVLTVRQLSDLLAYIRTIR